MNTVHERPTHNGPTSLRDRPWARPGLLVILAQILVGGATGILTGSPVGVAALAVVGLAWGAVLTLAATWLAGTQGPRRGGAIAILAVLFVLVALMAGSLPENRALGAAIIVVLVAVGASLILTGRWLDRQRPSRTAWARAVTFHLVLLLGMLTGSGMAGHLIVATALDAAPPEVFTALVRGTLGDAEALPYYLLNTPIEWLLLPLAVLLTWPVAAQRRLMLPALTVFVAMRLWTYVYFVPRITAWDQGTTPLTSGQLDQAMVWADLTWIRFAVDVITLLLVLVAAFAGSESPAARTPDRRSGLQEA